MKILFEKIKNFCVKNLIGVVLISLCLILIIAGTGVLMASGTTMAIENVHVGDMVKSYNSATGKVENKRVLQTFENETDELVTVSTSDGQQITSTPGHKYYANYKWVSAEDLRAGDVLVNVNGEKVIVEQIQHEILESPVKIYNFEVADNHTYFVGDGNGVAVHNRNCTKGNAVYMGVRKDLEINNKYIGRTNNVAKRMYQHQHSKKYPRNLVDVEYLDGLSKEESQILEQALIKANGGIEKLDNYINGMSTSNPLYKKLDTDGIELLKRFFRDKIKFLR